jgi:hypothetical protein
MWQTDVRCHRLQRMIVVPSGPRAGDTKLRARLNPAFNANISRLMAGWQQLMGADDWLFVSGTSGERSRLRYEARQVWSRVYPQLAYPKTQVAVSSLARHTAGNAAVALEEARCRYGWDDLIQMVVCTDDWHMPRVRLCYQGIQALLQRWNARWQAALPIEFVFVTCADMLAPSFRSQYERLESYKYQAMTERLARWQAGFPDDAPTYMKVMARQRQSGQALPVPVRDSDDFDTIMTTMIYRQARRRTMGLEDQPSVP